MWRSQAPSEKLIPGTIHLPTLKLGKCHSITVVDCLFYVSLWHVVASIALSWALYPDIWLYLSLLRLRCWMYLLPLISPASSPFSLILCSYGKANWWANGGVYWGNYNLHAPHHSPFPSFAVSLFFLPSPPPFLSILPSSPLLCSFSSGFLPPPPHPLFLFPHSELISVPPLFLSWLFPSSLSVTSEDDYFTEILDYAYSNLDPTGHYDNRLLLVTQPYLYQSTLTRKEEGVCAWEERKMREGVREAVYQ